MVAYPYNTQHSNTTAPQYEVVVNEQLTSDDVLVITSLSDVLLGYCELYLSKGEGDRNKGKEIIDTILKLTEILNKFIKQKNGKR